MRDTVFDMSQSEPDYSPEALTATLVKYADGPDQLTIHPADADDVTLMGSWLTADAGAFVELDSFR
jgi:hypothetical protein